MTGGPDEKSGDKKPKDLPAIPDRTPRVRWINLQNESSIRLTADQWKDYLLLASYSNKHWRPKRKFLDSNMELILRQPQERFEYDDWMDGTKSRTLVKLFQYSINGCTLSVREALQIDRAIAVSLKRGYNLPDPADWNTLGHVYPQLSLLPQESIITVERLPHVLP